MTLKRYEDYVRDILPWWMLGDWGSFFETIGAFVDLTWEQTREAALARFADRCPADALQYAAREAQVPTFADLDTEGEIRTRTQTAWTWHAEKATSAGFDSLFAILGLDPAETGYLDSSNGPHWFTETWYSAFAIASRNPLEWGLRTETWDELEARGLSWSSLEALGECWAFTCPASLFTQLREWMWTEKWVHGVPIHFVCSFGTGHTWDSLIVQGSTWDDLNTAGDTWDDVGDAEAVVLQTARIWDAQNLEDGNAPLTWDQYEALGVRWARLMTGRN